MNKRVLVAWSGGLDSTFMIQHYLALGYGVDVINCNLTNARPAQMKREQRAMSKMLKGYFKDKDVQPIGASHIRLGGNCFQALNLAQIPVWLFNLISYLRPEHTEVALGYVMNDDAVSFLDSISAIWNGYSGLVNMDLPPLAYPLIRYKKYRIFSEIHPELRKHVTWCENPEPADRCGMCPSCKKMIDQYLQLPPVLVESNTIEEPTLIEEETRC